MNNQTTLSRGQLVKVLAGVALFLDNVARVFQIERRHMPHQCKVHCNVCDKCFYGVSPLIQHINEHDRLTLTGQPISKVIMHAPRDGFFLEALMVESLLQRELRGKVAIGLSHVVEIVESAQLSQYTCLLCEASDLYDFNDTEHLTGLNHMWEFLWRHFPNVMTEYNKFNLFANEKYFKNKVVYHSSLVIAHNLQHVIPHRLTNFDYEQMQPEINATLNTPIFMPNEQHSISTDLVENFHKIRQNYGHLQMLLGAIDALWYFQMHIKPIMGLLLALTNTVDGSKMDPSCDGKKVISNEFNLSILSACKLFVNISLNKNRIESGKIAQAEEVVESIDSFIAAVTGKRVDSSKEILDGLIKALNEKGFQDEYYMEALQAFQAEITEPPPPGVMVEEMDVDEAEEIPPRPPVQKRKELKFEDSF